MSSAIRLTRDLDRLQHDPSLTDISARPLPDDIMRWHGNLRWLTGKILHFELVFGLNYPAAPPSIRLFDIIRHFCVDQATGEVSTSFLLDGWSSAYELQSILVTLQSFLCDTSLLHDTHHAGRSIPEVHRDCGCPVIPLCSTPPEPQFVDQHLTTADYALESAARYQPDGLRQLPFDIAIRCCAFLDVHHVRMLSLTGVSCRLVTLVVQQIREQRRVQKSLVCFHTKVAPEEEPLGICCSVGRHPMSGRLDALTTSMDVLSYSAFKFGAVGQDVMGKSFTHWMPLTGPCFTPALLEEACSKVLGVKTVQPEQVLQVMQVLLSSFVVSFATEPEAASIKQIAGAFACRRVLLAYVEATPILVDHISDKIRQFLTQPSERHKSNMPNLSHFLALLAVPCCPGYTWTNLALPVLNESLDRSVQWFIRKFPAMHRFDPKASTEQESDSYLKCRLETAAIGLQLQIVFSILFDPLSRAGISHVSQDLSTVPGVAAMLDSHSGFGPDIEHQRVQRQLRQLGKVSDWHRMLEWFRLEWVSKDVLLQWLVQAQRRSLARKYHSAGMAATVLQKGDVFSIRPCMEQLQLTLGWVYSAEKKQYLDASVLITSDEALLGVVDYRPSRKRFGHDGIVHSGDVLNRKTHTGQHDIEINLSALPGAATKLYVVLSGYTTALGALSMPWVRLVETSNQEEELCRYNISATSDAHTALFMCCISQNKQTGHWQLEPIHALCNGRVSNYSPIFDQLATLLDKPRSAIQMPSIVEMPSPTTIAAPPYGQGRAGAGRGRGAGRGAGRGVGFGAVCQPFVRSRYAIDSSNHSDQLVHLFDQPQLVHWAPSRKRTRTQYEGIGAFVSAFEDNASCSTPSPETRTEAEASATIARWVELVAPSVLPKLPLCKVSFRVLDRQIKLLVENEINSLTAVEISKSQAFSVYKRVKQKVLKQRRQQRRECSTVGEQQRASQLQMERWTVPTPSNNRASSWLCHHKSLRLRNLWPEATLQTIVARVEQAELRGVECVLFWKGHNECVIGFESDKHMQRAFVMISCARMILARECDESMVVAFIEKESVWNP